jgi:hypothetical protein
MAYKHKMNLHLKKGALHREMGLKQGKKIGVGALQKEKAKGGLAAKRANFALNARKWKHGGKKKSKGAGSMSNKQFHSHKAWGK